MNTKMQELLMKQMIRVFLYQYINDCKQNERIDCLDYCNTSWIISDKEIKDLMIYVDAMMNDVENAERKCLEQGVICKSYFRAIYKLVEDWSNQEIEAIYNFDNCTNINNYH